MNTSPGARRRLLGVVGSAPASRSPSCRRWPPSGGCGNRPGRRCRCRRQRRALRLGRRRRGMCCERAMPEATMDTRTLSPSASSKVAPTMMLASGSTSWRTRLAASSTSHSVRSRPPVMDSSRLLAPFSVTSSSSGLTMASSAATIARCSPDGLAGAHHGGAHAAQHVLTSARSRLMSPSLTIRSTMQATPE